MCSVTTPRPKFESVHYTAIFVLKAILRQVYRMTFKMTLLMIKVRYTLYVIHYYPRDLNFTQILSTLSHFRVKGHFETNTPNDPKMTSTKSSE